MANQQTMPAEGPAPKTPKASAAPAQPGDGLLVVGIGASAGGLEALRALLPGLPAGADTAYIIAQHMDPKYRSAMVELLGPYTAMAVVSAEDGQAVCADTVYVTPPGRNVTLRKGKIRLTTPAAGAAAKPSVDVLFASLADERGEKAAGIVLSGTGFDGASGIRAIKAGGGITLVQDPETAKFNGMPQAAIATGHVDLILAPGRIGAEIPNIINRGAVDPKRVARAAGEMERLLGLVRERTGTDFSGYKSSTIERRILRRMAVHKLDTLANYLQYLDHSATEVQSLHQDILVSVTAFFRDADAFSALETVLTELVAARSRRGGALRVWVPGCATGEEAYSIAILLDRILGADRVGPRVQIFGTDLDEKAVAAARKGIYPESALADVDPQVIGQYFRPAGSAFQVVKPIRDLVVFARQNLLSDPPFSRLDLISCRNLLIYFGLKLQRRVLPMFNYVTSPGGYLFLGRSESVGQFTDLYEPVDKRWRIYRRLTSTRAHHPVLSASFPPARHQPAVQVSEPDRRPSIREAMTEAIAEVFAPDGVVVDEQMNVRHVRGDVSLYLGIPAGEASLALLGLARAELRLDLRALVHRAQREGTTQVSHPIALVEGDVTHRVRLHVRPLKLSEDTKPMTLVLFEPQPEPVPGLAANEADVLVPDPRVTELEKELSATREHLQFTVEEVETSNEELQSVNEELQSANEELQSSNEELETANEELQSTNEELITVNEELQIKQSELTAVNSDVENVLRSIGFPLLVVDRHLRVLRFTPAASALFMLGSESIGHTITSLPSHIDLPDLRQGITQVVAESKPSEDLIETDEAVYRMDILPYIGEQGRTTGAVLVFQDRTQARRAKEALEKSEALLRAIVDNVLYGIITISEDGYIQAFNTAAETLFGYRADEVIGKSVNLLMPEPERSRHDGYIQGYLHTGETHVVGKTRRLNGLHKDGSAVPMQITVSEAQLGGRRVFIGIASSEER